MADRFKNKYRIPSARAGWWDYAADAAYFVTICTKNRVLYFGTVVDSVLELSEIGKIAHRCWAAIPEHFPSVILGEFVIMPNHLHGIVVIDKENAIADDNPVETLHATSLRPNETNKFMSKISPKPQSLPAVIRSFKSAVTYSVRQTDPDFAWQPRYHDRIIRDQPEHERITSYIQNNPKNWQEDNLFPPSGNR